MKIEDRLFTVKFVPDEVSHLEIKDSRVCREECLHKPCTTFCPARVYQWDELEKVITVGYEGCFECGACRVGCPYLNISWRYPRGGYGVSYRFG